MSKRKQNLVGYLFALPWFIGFSVFLAYPLVASIYFSFCDYSVLKKPVFIGLDNYRELFADEVFWITVKNTAIYAAISLPAGMVMALGLAMLLNAKVPGTTFFRTVFFLPSLVPMVSLAVLWLWILNGEHGVLNEVLRMVGIRGPNWLGDPAWSKPALVVLGVWGVGNAVLIYLAGLQDVPTSLVEAAELDGASPWQKTRHVTIPMISPVILFNLIMGIIGTLQVFTVPYVMFPGGSPARSTYFYAMYLFDNAFLYNKMGYASALAWVIFAIILVLTGIQFLLARKWVHYEAGR
ncbi:MAG TPA: spermidine/putrescine ABC transporter permease [Armatimonadetes bacterium]|nr:spermidine/putrescine ABC transporter permease [Armatimonadota bacterium]